MVTLATVATVATVIIVGAWRFVNVGAAEVNGSGNKNNVEARVVNNDRSYVLSTSPHGDKKIVWNSKNELVLHVKSGNNETLKTIYKGYSPLSEDPYSMYNYTRYLIQWSQNEKYVFVRDSIYDIEANKLIKIKSNVAFTWIGNKGLYMDDGYYYTLPFDDGYSNYMAVSKKVKVFDGGKIRTLAVAKSNQYFVLDSIIMENMFKIANNSMIISTASLKDKAEELQKIINKEYRGMMKAIYKKKKIGRFDQPEAIIVNGSYYLKNISSIKIQIK